MVTTTVGAGLSALTMLVGKAVPAHITKENNAAFSDQRDEDKESRARPVLLVIGEIVVIFQLSN
ncbi:MAG: hypothetical protein DHS20C08_04060 [Rhodomicrobium sp.]|nr:MAG: hypothetical protein DHS20C08_04060 [Rhodomicrobium sp.]